ncbi:MAG: LPS export ABC transporter permease LptG [Rubrivivax sp.]|nr:LPS export ABC transporter permease LptG [Rubrivivax sp.]
MKTVRRLLYRDIVASVGFVALAFLALFYFIDFVDTLGDIGTKGRGALDAAWSAALELPGHLYELLPIAVLIGTIYSLARLAQSSEFTILRTGGLGPWRALGLLAVLGVAFSALTFAIGDYLAPRAEREVVLFKARTSGGVRAGDAGAWLKERRRTAEGERSYSIHIGGTSGGGALAEVRIFEFDDDGRLVTRIEAREGRVADDGTWTLVDGEQARWPRARAEGQPPVQVQRFASLQWPSTLTPEVVAAAVLPLRTMSTLELWRYSAHLSDQEQSAQRHQIQFWKKALYPMACLVMVALALPFAYMHARSGSVSLKVFGGIMLGIAFVLLNNLAGHIGLLNGWVPWAAAATPSLLFLAMSMAAFAWLVRYR